MRSADKVALVNAMHRAYLNAFAASGTLFVVDDRKIILYGNSTELTVALALSAADTAVFAILSCFCSLIVIGAFNNNSDSIVYKMYNTVGAGTRTESAADTLARIYLCNTVNNGNCVVGTNGNTVAVAKAGIYTDSVALISHICDTAGLLSDIFVFFIHGVTASVTRNVGNLFNNIARFNTDYLCNSSGSSVTAGNTEICLVGLTLGKSLCISITSAVAASSAVSAGKLIANSGKFFVFLYAEQHICDRKKHGAHKSYSKQNSYGN